MALDFANLGTSIKNDAQGLIGNIAKAVIVFPDPVKAIKLEDMEAVNAFGSSLGVGKVATTVYSMEKRNKMASISQAAATTSTIMHNFGDGAQSLENGLGGLGGKLFTVQFNPSSLQVTARGGGRSMVSNIGGTDNEQSTTITYRALDPYITVSFSIVFDATNQADAFMEERLTLGATTLAKNVTTAIVGKEYTVRPQVEGFMAAIRNEDHRPMIFQWGSLRYIGILNSVSGKYTMFNTVGNPIRAEVQLSMLMGGAPKDSFDGASYLDYWKKRYSDILQKNAAKDGEENISSMSTGTIKNQYRNLINL